MAPNPLPGVVDDRGADGSPSGRARVVIVGGGIAALEAVLELERIGGSRLDLTLLSSDRRFTYAPLSIVEAFSGGRAYRLELTALLAGRDVAVIEGRLDSVDHEVRRLELSDGRALSYDAALIAVGARRRGAVPGAITFAGRKAGSELDELMQTAKAGRIERIAVVVPSGVAWSLPAYELALLTAARLAEDSVAVEVALVSAEPRPVDLFGEGPSQAVGELLAARGIKFRSAVVERVAAGQLMLHRGGPIAADAVIALPVPVAPAVTGLPRDERGFMPVDERCRAVGAERLYGAGDVTDSTLKQGGIAAQQADVAAAAIAADLGLGPEPDPLRPVLSGLLLTGPPPRSRRLELGRAKMAPRELREGELPPAKVAGRLLAPFLAERGVPPGAPPGMVAIELTREAAVSPRP